MGHKGHYGEYTGNAKHSRKTNSWEEQDVKRGRREERKGHYGHAEALFDDAHGSYNWDGHNSTGAEHGTSRRSSSPLNDEGHGGTPGHGHATGTISEDKLDFSGSTSMHEGEKPSPKLVSGDMSFEPHDKDYENYPNPWEEPDYEDPNYKPKTTSNFMEKKLAFKNKGEKKFGREASSPLNDNTKKPSWMGQKSQPGLEGGGDTRKKTPPPKPPRYQT